MTIMATLHVRNVPPEIYETLRDRAARRGQSINTMVIEILEETAERSRAEAKMRERLEDIARRFPLPPDAPNPEDLIREDRDSR